MRDKPVCMDHAIIWKAQPYMVDDRTGWYVGACRVCGRTFQRERPLPDAPIFGQMDRDAANHEKRFGS